MRTLLVVILAAALGGCCADAQYAKSVKRGADLLLPDLEAVYAAPLDAKVGDVLPDLVGSDEADTAKRRERYLGLLREWRANIDSGAEED